MRILYVSCSAYSGSTFLSFLLNTHPDVVTIGHSTGWNFGQDEEFRCSCGRPLESCPFYRTVEQAFKKQGLPFDIRNFGTEYRLASSDLLNRVLAADIPKLRFSFVDRVRDRLVGSLPPLAARLRRQDLANATLISAALEYRRAKLFVDNSHVPYRIPHLKRLPGVDLRNVHLVRDPRGVALSNMIRKRWSPELAITMWVRQQSEIVRVAGALVPTTTVYYEELCDSTNETLGAIERFAGLPPQPFEGDFKATEHHILGNVMRLKEGRVVRDDRWRRELTPAQLESIRSTALARAPRDSAHPVARIVRHYFESA